MRFQLPMLLCLGLMGGSLECGACQEKAPGISPTTVTSCSASTEQVRDQEQEQNQEQVARLWRESQNAVKAADYVTAEKRLTDLLKLEPKFSFAYYQRGRVRFQAGDVQGSVNDFDRHVKLSPELKTRQWERGISLYYAEKFELGAKQFEIYQTYHDNDVENSTWRFLCVARDKGIAVARKNLLPIKNDTRIPMMQIYKLYQGKLTSAEVLKAAEELPANDLEKNSARFYANLYVGLLLEIEGKKVESLKHIKAAQKSKINHYMWDVANIHLRLRTKKKPGSK